MPKLTPQEATAKHARNLKNSIQDITTGVNRVSVAPGAQAAAKSEKMLQNLTKSVQSGKWGRRVAAVPLAEWQNAMNTKGVQRVASGIDAAKEKVESFYAELFPYQAGLESKIKALPDLTLEDSLNRMTTWVRGMAGFQRK